MVNDNYILEYLEKLEFAFKQLAIHEKQYKTRKKSAMYFANLSILKKRIWMIEDKLHNVGKTVNVVKCYYQSKEVIKSMPKEGLRVTGGRLIDHCMIFSNVSLGVAIKLVKFTHKDALNITAQEIKLGVEISE